MYLTLIADLSLRISVPTGSACFHHSGYMPFSKFLLLQQCYNKCKVHQRNYTEKAQSCKCMYKLTDMMDGNYSKGSPDNNNNNNTQIATIALPPLTMYPQ